MESYENSDEDSEPKFKSTKSFVSDITTVKEQKERNRKHVLEKRNQYAQDREYQQFQEFLKYQHFKKQQEKNQDFMDEYYARNKKIPPPPPRDKIPPPPPRKTKHNIPPPPPIGGYAPPVKPRVPESNPENNLESNTEEGRGRRGNLGFPTRNDEKMKERRNIKLMETLKKALNEDIRATAEKLKAQSDITPEEKEQIELADDQLKPQSQPLNMAQKQSADDVKRQVNKKSSKPPPLAPKMEKQFSPNERRQLMLDLQVAATKAKMMEQMKEPMPSGKELDMRAELAYLKKRKQEREKSEKRRAKLQEKIMLKEQAEELRRQRQNQDTVAEVTNPMLGKKTRVRKEKKPPVNAEEFGYDMVYTPPPSERTFDTETVTMQVNPAKTPPPPPPPQFPTWKKKPILALRSPEERIVKHKEGKTINNIDMNEYDNQLKFIEAKKIVSKMPDEVKKIKNIIDETEQLKAISEYNSKRKVAIAYLNSVGVRDMRGEPLDVDKNYIPADLSHYINNYEESQNRTNDDDEVEREKKIVQLQALVDQYDQENDAKYKAQLLENVRASYKAVIGKKLSTITKRTDTIKKNINDFLITRQMLASLEPKKGVSTRASTRAASAKTVVSRGSHYSTKTVDDVTDITFT